MVLPSHSLHVLADRHALSGFGGHAEFIPNSPGGVTSGIRFVFACVPIETVTGGSDNGTASSRSGVDRSGVDRSGFDDSLLMFLASSLPLLDGVLLLRLGFLIVPDGIKTMSDIVPIVNSITIVFVVDKIHIISHPDAPLVKVYPLIVALLIHRIGIVANIAGKGRECGTCRH